MNASSTEYFTPGQIQALRREVAEHGVIPDPFLSTDPDRSVFGLNLACCWPFPVEVEKSYNALAEKLAALDAGVYVYPFWETHITLVTFASFALSKQPKAELEVLVLQIIECLPREFTAPFRLEFHPPVLMRKAAILPISNPGGEIAAIRKSVLQCLEANPSLHDSLTKAGLNIPNIIHSTVMRFRSAPVDLPTFLDGFSAIAAEHNFGTITVPKLLLTAETKPYMRGGKILHKWPLTCGGGRPRLP